MLPVEKTNSIDVIIRPTNRYVPECRRNAGDEVADHTK
jgi:hypothetical protein